LKKVAVFDKKLFPFKLVYF